MIDGDCGRRHLAALPGGPGHLVCQAADARPISALRRLPLALELLNIPALLRPLRACARLQPSSAVPGRPRCRPSASCYTRQGSGGAAHPYRAQSPACEAEIRVSRAVHHAPAVRRTLPLCRRSAQPSSVESAIITFLS